VAGVRRLLVAVTAGAALMVSVPAGAATGDPLAAQLRAAADRAEASAAELARLAGSGSPSEASLTAAASQLAQAAEAARVVLGRYRGSSHGTREEYELLRTMTQRITEASASLAAARGRQTAPSAQQQAAAQRQVGLLRQLVAQKVEERLQVEGLADVLTARSFAEARGLVVGEVERRVRAYGEAELERLTGVGIALGVPLAEQVRRSAEAYLARLLAKLTVSAGPAGIVIQIVAGKLIDPARIVRLVGDGLREALRQKGELEPRTARTAAGFDALAREFEQLPDNPRLADVHRLGRRLERAVNSTRFLEGDLRRAKRSDLLQRIEQARQRALDAARASLLRAQLDPELLDFPFAEKIGLVTRARDAARTLGGSATSSPGAGATPTAAACVPGFTMESIRSLPPHDVTGTFDVRLAGLVKTYPTSDLYYKCLYVRSDNPAAEAFVVFLELVPIGTPGAISSGNCDGRRQSSHPFYHSRTRQLTVSGGPRGLYTRAAGGDGAKLQEALRRAEAAGVGRPCPR
jgi:hypothetical protein